MSETGRAASRWLDSLGFPQPWRGSWRRRPPRVEKRYPSVMTSRPSLALPRILFIGLLLTLPPVAAAAETGADAVLGRYWLPDRDGQIEIYEAGGLYRGKVVAYDVAGQLDEKNPDPKRRSRPFVGIDMFWDFRFDPSEKQWVDGRIYDANDGSTYSCYLWFEDGDPSVLWARGYIGVSFLGRTEKFDRVAPAGSGR